jgi:hypothetical protein
VNHFDTWTVYEHPADYPEGYVVRVWRIASGGDIEMGRARMAGSLEEARALIPIDQLGLVRIARELDDDPAVYETWF